MAPTMPPRRVLFALAVGLGGGMPACKDDGPPPAARGSAPESPLKVALGKAQEKVTLLEAALMRLQGEIKVAEDAGDAATLAGLRDKEIALRSALGNARLALRNTERMMSSGDGAGAGTPPTR